MPVSIESLSQVLVNHRDYTVTPLEGCLKITNQEGIDCFLTVSDRQILVESTLFPASAVNDITGLNEQILRTQHLVPLSSVGVKDIAGQDYYFAFGALSSDSHEASVMQELDTLFANIDDFLELYSDNLHKEV